MNIDHQCVPIFHTTRHFLLMSWHYTADINIRAWVGNHRFIICVFIVIDEYCINLKSPILLAFPIVNTRTKWTFRHTSSDRGHMAGFIFPHPWYHKSGFICSIKHIKWHCILFRKMINNYPYLPSITSPRNSLTNGCQIETWSYVRNNDNYANTLIKFLQIWYS